MTINKQLWNPTLSSPFTSLLFRHTATLLCVIMTHSEIRFNLQHQQQQQHLKTVFKNDLTLYLTPREKKAVKLSAKASTHINFCSTDSQLPHSQSVSNFPHFCTFFSKHFTTKHKVTSQFNYEW